MSFSGNAKAEICKIPIQRKCCALAESFGILLYCNTFSGEMLKIVTESRELASRLPKLFQRAFAVNFDQLPEQTGPGKRVFLITGREKLKTIMSACGFDPADTLSLHVNLSVLEDDCCKAAFLRGAFLAGGSVTDPEKTYHMELATVHQSVARETYALMQELLHFYPKTAQRGGAAVIYLKQSERIADLLTFLGAPIASMGIMETRLEKEFKNNINRRVNCDDANLTKVVDAAQEQLAAIRALRRSGRLDSLPPKLLQAALARESNPEASLTELAALMEPPISKPAMNHRLQKLQEIAKEV
ncbi:MAG: DNA-binding protein WhiA [Faecousia sp.]